MKGYKEVNSQKDIEDLLDRYSGFHDSILKEVHVVNEAYVASGNTYMPETYDVWLLFQSPFDPFGLELVAIGISELSLGEAGSYYNGLGKFIPNVLSASSVMRLKLDTGFSIEAKRLFFRERPDWLGRSIFLNGEIPSPDAVPAARIGGNWRQCSNCADAWEEPNRVVYSRCPSCERLTWVDEHDKPERTLDGDSDTRL
ncbi:MAG: hypothetical protein PVH65_17000 [Chloroflexota bacterium]|jgi:hypothetical protein